MRRADEVDARLLATREAYYAAMDRGDLDAVDVLYAELDELLDERAHIPHPRLPSDQPIRPAQAY